MINLITIFCLAYIITTTDFPLVKLIKTWLGLDENRTIISKNKYLDWLYKSIHKILNCPICCSFWLMLILTLNIKYAIISYVVMVVFVKVLDLLDTYIRF